jgi:outer membrane protein TolC
VLQTYAQNGFDSYLLKDSLYRYNSSLKVLDSLFLAQVNATVKDTAFYNTFGKAGGINLSQLLYAAVNNNPELGVIQTKIESSKYSAEEKNYLPDPTFEFELDDVMTDFQKVGMINFYIRQMFPFPGKLELERKSVLNSRDMLQAENLEIAVNILNLVKTNYYDLYLLSKKLQINKDNQLIVKTFNASTESQYMVGKGMQQEVFKSQVEFSRLQNEEFVIKQQRKNILSELTKLTKLEIDENTRITFSEIDTDYLLDNSHFNIDEKIADKLVDYAFEKRADLKSLRSKILMNKTELEIAKISRMPDFMVRLGYKILPYETTNAFNFMFGINLPFAPWSSGKYDYAVQKNKINIKSASYEYESKKNEIRNEIISIANNMSSLKETMNFYYRVQIPQTENTMKSAQYSYETNMTGFLDLLDSYRTYQEAKLMFYESVNMYLKMIAELEKASGVNLKN